MRFDSHAESAAAIFSLVASCRLHGIDPQQYLDAVMRVLPEWSKNRHLELSPKRRDTMAASSSPGLSVVELAGGLVDERGSRRRAR